MLTATKTRPETDEQKLARLFLRFQKNPAWWCEQVLGEKPWPRQVEVMNAVRDHPRVAVRSGHKVGKSWTVARLVLWFLFSFRPSKIVTTAPTLRQVRDILWDEIAIAYDKAQDHNAYLGGELLTTRLHVKPGWYAIGVSTNKAVNFQGVHQEHVLFVFDEAFGVERKIWEAAEGSMSGPHTRWVAIGNPLAPVGQFHDCFNSPLWQKIAISSYEAAESGNMALATKEWCDEKKAAWGATSPLFMSRVMGEFPNISEFGLVPRGWIKDAIERYESQNPTNEVRIGVDVAKFSGDETTWCVRRGRLVEELIGVTYNSRQLTTTETVGRTKRLIEETGANPRFVFIDDIGIGHGVSDGLREHGFDIVPVNFGEAADDPGEFLNKRAECYWRCREAFGPEGIGIAIPDDERLIADLIVTEYGHTSRGQIKIEKKEDIKEKLGRSPDRGDALALTFAVDENASPEDEEIDLEVFSV